MEQEYWFLLDGACGTLGWVGDNVHEPSTWRRAKIMNLGQDGTDFIEVIEGRIVHPVHQILFATPHIIWRGDFRLYVDGEQLESLQSKMDHLIYIIVEGVFLKDAQLAGFDPLKMENLFCQIPVEKRGAENAFEVITTHFLEFYLHRHELFLSALERQQHCEHKRAKETFNLSIVRACPKDIIAPNNKAPETVSDLKEYTCGNRADPLRKLWTTVRVKLMNRIRSLCKELLSSERQGVWEKLAFVKHLHDQLHEKKDSISEHLWIVHSPVIAAAISMEIGRLFTMDSFWRDKWNGSGAHFCFSPVLQQRRPNLPWTTQDALAIDEPDESVSFLHPTSVEYGLSVRRMCLAALWPTVDHLWALPDEMRAAWLSQFSYHLNTYKDASNIWAVDPFVTENEFNKVADKSRFRPLFVSANPSVWRDVMPSLFDEFLFCFASPLIELRSRHVATMPIQRSIKLALFRGEEDWSKCISTFLESPHGIFDIWKRVIMNLEKDGLPRRYTADALLKTGMPRVVPVRFEVTAITCLARNFETSFPRGVYYDVFPKLANIKLTPAQIKALLRRCLPPGHAYVAILSASHVSQRCLGLDLRWAVQSINELPRCLVELAGKVLAHPNELIPMDHPVVLDPCSSVDNTRQWYLQGVMRLEIKWWWDALRKFWIENNGPDSLLFADKTSPLPSYSGISAFQDAVRCIREKSADANLLICLPWFLMHSAPQLKKWCPNVWKVVPVQDLRYTINNAGDTPFVVVWMWMDWASPAELVIMTAALMNINTCKARVLLDATVLERRNLALFNRKLVLHMSSTPPVAAWRDHWAPIHLAAQLCALKPELTTNWFNVPTYYANWTHDTAKVIPEYLIRAKLYIKDIVPPRLDGLLSLLPALSSQVGRIDHSTNLQRNIMSLCDHIVTKTQLL